MHTTSLFPSYCLVLGYRKHAPGYAILETLERDARDAKNGFGPIRCRCRRGNGGMQYAGNCLPEDSTRGRDAISALTPSVRHSRFPVGTLFGLNRKDSDAVKRMVMNWPLWACG